MKLKNRIKVVSCGLAFFYCLTLLYLFLTGKMYSINFTLSALLLVSAVGMALYQEWGRKFTLFFSAVTIVYVLVKTLSLSVGYNLPMFLAALLMVAVINLYRQPYCKKIFKDGLNPPAWNILLVDDDKTFLKLMKANFLKEGVIVSGVDTGEKGLEAALRKQPDLIILDVVLPGIKGYEVCSRLKEDTRTRDIPIIFLTVKNEPAEIKTEMEMGGVFHMSKPVNFKELYGEIKTILGHKS